MTRILFQGDSITDANRTVEYATRNGIGIGYALMVNAELGVKYPGEYEFINRGIGGNQIVDLYARLKRDVINLQPDVMSILIGVNDVWQEIAENVGADAEKYYKIYDIMIQEIKEALPDIKIMIMEPFVLKASATEENWDTFRPEVEKRAVMAKKIAEKHKLTFIPLQAEFDALAEKVSPDYWLYDGVHPTPMGHTIIRDRWLEAFKTL